MPDLPDGDVLVFDVGGTTLRAGLYSPAARRLLGVRRSFTPDLVDRTGGGGREPVDRILVQMERLGRELAGGRPALVSVAFAGPIDLRGRALAAPTIWGAGPSGPLSLLDALERTWPDSRVFLLNDVTAAGYFYLRHPSDDLCLFTVSSGIGHKVFVQGRPLLGPGGRGGELGHLRVDSSPDAPCCECGGRGHLGALASGRAAVHHVRRLAGKDPVGFRASELGRRIGGRIDRYRNEVLVDAVREGDEWALRVVHAMAQPLGQVLAAVHLATGVERFVIMGGFASALGPGYLRRLAEAARASGWDRGADWSEMLEPGNDEDDAGMMGAGLFAAGIGADARPAAWREELRTPSE